jgi:hypothetical protein
VNNEVKAMWVAALRSGEYKKTTGVLCRNHFKTGELCFCTLGVLCNLWHNVVGEAEGSRGWQHAPEKGGYAMEMCTGMLPLRVREWAGIVEIDPKIEWLDSYGGRHNDTISEINDMHKLTFSEIADLIERNL